MTVTIQIRNRRKRAYVQILRQLRAHPLPGCIPLEKSRPGHHLVFPVTVQVRNHQSLCMTIFRDNMQTVVRPRRHPRIGRNVIVAHHLRSLRGEHDLDLSVAVHIPYGLVVILLEPVRNQMYRPPLRGIVRALEPVEFRIRMALLGVHRISGHNIQPAVAGQIHQHPARLQMGGRNHVAFPRRVLIPYQVIIPVLGAHHNVVAPVSVDIPNQAHVILPAQRLVVDDLVFKDQRLLFTHRTHLHWLLMPAFSMVHVSLVRRANTRFAPTNMTS